MYRYKVLINGMSITTVWGRNGDEALETANRQLNRPGRYGVLKKWQAGGSKLQIALDAQRAIEILTERDSSEAVCALEAAVAAMCKTPTAGMNEWLMAGDFDGSETVESLAAEWDDLGQ